MTTQPNAVVFPDGKTPANKLDQFFLEHRTAGQSFVIDATRRTTLVGIRGTRLTIFPNSFTDSGGRPVKEHINLRLREVFSRSDMVLAGLTNTSEDRVLESAGQILLEAKSEGFPLQLTVPILVDLPLQNGLDNPLASQVFTGGVSQTSAYGSGLRFDWKAAREQRIQLRTLGDKKYLHFALTSMNWWNCTSFFHRRRQRIMISARWSAEELPVDELAAFLVFRDVNAVVRMYPSRHGFSSWNIPKGVPACIVLVGFSGQGEEMLIGRSGWALTSSQPIQIRIEKMRRGEVISRIPEWCS